MLLVCHGLRGGGGVEGGGVEDMNSQCIGQHMARISLQQIQK